MVLRASAKSNFRVGMSVCGSDLSWKEVLWTFLFRKLRPQLVKLCYMMYNLVLYVVCIIISFLVLLPGGDTLVSSPNESQL